MRITPKIIILFIFRTIWIIILTIVFAIVFAVVYNKKFRAKLLKRYLELCGSAFIKLGQVLAMRYDLLDDRYCNELSTLLDDVSPIQFSKVKALIESSFNKKISNLFLSINPIPLASASIAQVHEAQLHTGEEVVIKVMKPGFRDLFYVDLAYLKFLGIIVDQLGVFKKIDVKQVVRELIKLTWEEFDFRREARNIEKMHKLLLCDDIAHYAPRLYPEFCNSHVIVMEKINGVSVKQMISAIENHDVSRLQEWQKQGISLKRTSRILLRSILEQCMRHRYFQADPHSANIIVMNDGTLAWVDFGMIGWLDETLWSLQFKLRVAIANGNVHEAFSAILTTLQPIPAVDLTLFEAEIKDHIRDWILASEDPNATIVEKSSGNLFLKIFSSIRRSGLSMPPGLARMYRTFIIADMVMIKLDPTIDWMPTLKEFIRDEQMRLIGVIAKKSFDLDNVASGVQFLSSLPKNALEFSQWLQSQLPEYGRSYRIFLSRTERISLMLFEYLRNLNYLFLAIVILMKLFKFDWFSKFGGLNQVIDQNLWLVITVSIVTSFLFNRVIHQFKRSNY